MSRREHFDSGHNNSAHFELEDRGGTSERYRLTMHTPEHPEAAYVNYDIEYPYPMKEGNPYAPIRIGYLKSQHEKRGYARKLMEHLYQQNPKRAINWGSTVHPASTHLAEQFKEKYPERTEFQPEDDGDSVEGSQ